MSDKTKNKLLAILLVALVVGGFFLLLKLKDASRDRYAEENNCKWQVYSSYYICK